MMNLQNIKRLSGLALFMVSTSYAQMTPVGAWHSIDDKTGEAKAEIQIVEKDGVLTGRVTKSLRTDGAAKKICDECQDDRKGKEIIGMEIIRALKVDPSAELTWGGGGKILDPENGKESKTWFRVIERSKNNEAAFVAFWPRTGRMHQIRVHTADGLGCPIIGDEKYGGLNDILNKYHLSGRLHLHAARIVFRHPKTNELMDIKAPLPEDMKETFKVFGFNMAYDSDPFDDKRKDN
ncbi:MAG: DUF2147 domain-containing protein [Limnohabitans sp.]